MKQLTCEMCGGTDLMKQDGAFVCQNCGMKYSVEEAKKMMIEGTVDVQGTVKVDNSAFVQKYLANARRAMSKEDWDETEKYYNMVEQNDPTNIEAIFYSAYGKAKTCLTDNDIYRRQAIFKTLTNSVSIIDDNYDIEDEAQEKEILERITNDVIAMFGSEFVYTQTKNGYGTVTGDNKNQTYQLFINLAAEMFTTLTNIIEKFPADRRAEVVYIYKLRLKIAETLGFTSCVSLDSRKNWLEKCIGLAAEIKNLDPSFNVRDYNIGLQNIEKAKSNQKTGCCVGIICIVIIAIALGVIIGLS